MFRKTVLSLSLTLSLAAGLLAAPVVRAEGTNVISDRPTGAVMAADGLVVRPLGIVSTVLGAATWLVTLPFTLPSGSVREAGEVLVRDPAQFTFTRPLGEF